MLRLFVGAISLFVLSGCNFQSDLPGTLTTQEELTLQGDEGTWILPEGRSYDLLLTARTTNFFSNQEVWDLIVNQKATIQIQVDFKDWQVETHTFEADEIGQNFDLKATFHWESHKETVETFKKDGKCYERIVTTRYVEIAFEFLKPGTDALIATGFVSASNETETEEEIFGICI